MKYGALLVLMMCACFHISVSLCQPQETVDSSWHQYGGNAQHTGLGHFNLVPDGQKFAGFNVTYKESDWVGSNFVADSKGVFYAQFAEDRWPAYAVAYETLTKTRKWRTRLSDYDVGAPSTYSALSDDETLFYVATRTSLFALDTVDGGIVWNTSLHAYEAAPSITLGPQTGNVYISAVLYVACYNATTGVQMWNQSRPDGRGFSASFFTALAIDEGETVGVVGYGADSSPIGGIVGYKLLGRQNTPLWTRTYDSGGWTMAFQYPPMIYNGAVFAPMVGGGMVIIDYVTGASVWNGSGSDTFSNSYAPPTPILVSSNSTGIIFGWNVGFMESSCALCVYTPAGAYQSCVPTSIVVNNHTYNEPPTQQVLVANDQYAIVALGDFGSLHSSWGTVKVYRFNMETSKLEMVWAMDSADNGLSSLSSVLRTPNGSFWLSSPYALYQLQVLTVPQ